MSAPEPSTIWSSPHRSSDRDRMPSATARPSRVHAPGGEDSLMTWGARIGVLVLVLILTITLIVFMGDTMTSVFATG